MKPSNFLFIFSDEHRRSALGCYGHNIVQTPNLDALAQRGAVFENAYTPCPICVPARGSLATGKWVHQGRYWDNSFAFHGECPSWHERLRDLGHEVSATGKLHFRSSKDDNGFTEEMDTMHMARGVGDLMGSIRDPLPPPRAGHAGKLASTTGVKNCTYNNYDQRITANTIRWIEKQAKKQSNKPWAFMVSFSRPHYPLSCFKEFFDLYDPSKIVLPDYYKGDPKPRHPWIEELAANINYGDYFVNEDHIREGIASYYALLTFVDQQIGQIMRALDVAGFTDNTRVIYTTDHGDNLADRGLWGKSTMYEESASIPMILAGPDIDAGKRIKTPVSLVDIYATAIETLGHRVSHEDNALPSRSLYDFLKKEEPERSVISEYHAMGSNHASFMLRYKDWKYIQYVTMEPELFNLKDDPREVRNLAINPNHKGIQETCYRMLRSYCDPESIDEQARKEQKVLLGIHGGREAIISRGDMLYTPVPGEK
jgi:choline-sulfatase